VGGRLPKGIAGKDFFTEEEAAHLRLRVSESQFRAKRAEYGLQGFWWMGKKVYRKADVQMAMEGAWQRSPPRRGRHVLNWTDPQTGSAGTAPLGKVGTIPKRELDDILRIKEYELSTGARLLNAHRRPAPRFSDFVRQYKLWHQAEYPDSTYRVQQIIDDHLSREFGRRRSTCSRSKRSRPGRTSAASSWRTRRSRRSCACCSPSSTGRSS
jgi:hypothetical protein